MKVRQDSDICESLMTFFEKNKFLIRRQLRMRHNLNVYIQEHSKLIWWTVFDRD